MGSLRRFNQVRGREKERKKRGKKKRGRGEKRISISPAVV
jgi:hypothetical protein